MGRSFIALIASLFTCGALLAAAPVDEPLGGKPPADMKPSMEDYDYQIKYMRAFETALWAMPAVSIHGFKRATEAVGGEANTILAWSKVATAKAELLTANNNTPYILAMTNLRKGPVVVEIPPRSDKASLYGQIVDHWQYAIADVGPVGLDKGKGGKYLLLPPGYEGKTPEGYLVLKSPSYRVYFAFRSIKTPEASMEDAWAYAKQIRMYYLDDPQPTRFIDPSDQRFPTLPRYDEGFFQDMYEIFTLEPVREQDKIMMGYLASLGIEKGKPFKPDEKTRKAMRQAVADMYFYLQNQFKNPPEKMYYWPGKRKWQDVLTPDPNGNFSFVMDDMIDVDARANRYFFATYYPRSYYSPPANIYIYTLLDKDGNPIDGNKLYKLKIPADMPVKQFWSLILYDADTWAFIYTRENKVGISSFEMDKLKKDADGGVTLYFGPEPPEGLESNWIPTAGKRVAPAVRFYGVKQNMVDRSWLMPDVEPVN
ncbi:DUF1254 domain-containing protein [Thiolapillus sp.]